LKAIIFLEPLPRDDVSMDGVGVLVELPTLGELERTEVTVEVVRTDLQAHGFLPTGNRKHFKCLIKKRIGNEAHKN
jgi:hypothetical protein